VKWTDRLNDTEKKTVRRLERQRNKAVVDWQNGKISMNEARAIVARCNHEIARIAEGAA
jgi:hypothetical protein